MFIRGVTLALVLATTMFYSSIAQAEKRADGAGHVVHTRVAPVLLHRAVPPFKGVHTYQGQTARNRK